MDRPKPNMEARRLFTFAEVVGNRYLVRSFVGPDLDPILLSLEQDPSDFPKKRAERPHRCRIQHRVAEDVWQTLDLPGTDEDFHAVQPLGDDEWLLVRCRAQAEDDHNAHVYDASGQLVRSFHTGDGIQDVQTTRGGDIWVSYFDEGVFSGMCLGGSGLVRLDGRGECNSRFSGVHGGMPPDIVDCYALNVASDREVWLYYYTDFPLVKLVDGKVESVWSNVPVKGSPAFAVRGGMALFVGGYEDHDSLVLMRQGDKRGMRFAVRDEEGSPLEGFWAFGRRDRLFLQTKEALHMVETPDRLPTGRMR